MGKADCKYLYNIKFGKFCKYATNGKLSLIMHTCDRSCISALNQSEDSN